MPNNYLTSSPRRPPDPMTYLSMGIIKRRIFVHGKDEEFDDLPGELWQYDIHWKNWLNIDKYDHMPSSCYFSQIVVEDKWIYLIGCEDDTCDDPHINISRSDSEKFRWKFLTDLCEQYDNPNDIPYGVNYMFHYCNSLFIFADIYRNLPSNIIFRYSLLENSWSLVEQKGKVPKLMYNIYGSVFDDRFYCFGYTENITTYIFQVIYILDLKTYEWSQKTAYPDFDQYPSDRLYASISFSGTHGFLSGGQSESLETFDDLWSIDLRTLKWHKFKFKLENKIMKHTSAVHENSNLYLFGGMINNKTVNRLQKYIIEPPPLYKLCLYVLMKAIQEESELENLPIYIAQDIVPPQDDSSESEILDDDSD